MLIWARMRKGEHPPPYRGLPIQTLANDGFAVVGLCPERAVWYDSTFSAAHRRTVRLNNLFYREPGEDIPRQARNSPLDADLDETDSEFIERLGVVVFGTILAMDARPQLIERGKLLKRAGKGDKVREFWSPNIIGARYKLKREVPRIVDGKFAYAQREGGTHASPRMHWRRGHYRNQPYGPGLKEHKQIWIEPCVIGAQVGKGAN